MTDRELAIAKVVVGRQFRRRYARRKREFCSRPLGDTERAFARAYAREGSPEKEELHKLYIQFFPTAEQASASERGIQIAILKRHRSFKAAVAKELKLMDKHDEAIEKAGEDVTVTEVEEIKKLRSDTIRTLAMQVKVVEAAASAGALPIRGDAVMDQAMRVSGLLSGVGAVAGNTGEGTGGQIDAKIKEFAAKAKEQGFSVAPKPKEDVA